LNLAYTSYHTDLKLAVAAGLLEPDFLKQIPKSTRHRFKNTDFSKIFGMELVSSLNENMETIKQFVQDKQALKVYRAVNRIKTVLLQTIHQFKNLNTSFVQIKKRITDTILLVKDTLGFKRTLRYFKMSAGKFYAWLKEVQYTCKTSVLKKCFRRIPNQLTDKETSKMKALLSDDKFYLWPICSVAAYAAKNKLLTAALSTWYRYSAIFGLKRKLHKKKRYPVGLRASKPNQIWHADVMKIKTLDNLYAYIYIVMDNYSRFILSWTVALTLSGEIRRQTIMDAVKKYRTKEEDLYLVVDGGSENNNASVEDYIKNLPVPITKLVALKDIQFSNSMVEAVNKIIKYRSLHLMQMQNIHAAQEHLNSFIPEYNDIRPHCALGILTPKEVQLDGKIPDKHSLKEQFLAARRARVIENRKYSCGVCPV
jgi:transposase InsO family protein